MKLSVVSLRKCSWNKAIGLLTRILFYIWCYLITDMDAHLYLVFQIR